MTDLIRYTLTLTVDRPVRDEDDADWMPTAQAQRALEREALKALKTLDGDCDIEVIDTELIHEDGPDNIADTGVDTWAESRGER